MKREIMQSWKGVECGADEKGNGAGGTLCFYCLFIYNTRPRNISIFMSDVFGCYSTWKKGMDRRTKSDLPR